MAVAKVKTNRHGRLIRVIATRLMTDIQLDLFLYHRRLLCIRQAFHAPAKTRTKPLSINIQIKQQKRLDFYFNLFKGNYFTQQVLKHTSIVMYIT